MPVIALESQKATINKSYKSYRAMTPVEQRKNRKERGIGSGGMRDILQILSRGSG